MKSTLSSLIGSVSDYVVGASQKDQITANRAVKTLGTSLTIDPELLYFDNANYTRGHIPEFKMSALRGHHFDSMEVVGMVHLIKPGFIHQLSQLPPPKSLTLSFFTFEESVTGEASEGNERAIRNDLKSWNGSGVKVDMRTSDGSSSKSFTL